MVARRRLGAAAVAVGLSLAACTSSSDPGPTAQAPGGSDADAADAPILDGTGSSATTPLTVAPRTDERAGGGGAGGAEPTPATIVPEVPAPELVPEPVSDSFLVERVTIETGAGGSIDVHRPLDGGGWPLVVLYGDLDTDEAAYSPLATAIAEAGAVVAVSAFDADQPPVASACALSAATVWAEENRADPTRLTVVGIGAGAVAATGEALGGGWTTWSTAACTAGEPPIEPSALVTVDGRFGLYDDDDPTSEGLRAIDQVLAGGNPYVRIGVLQGEPLDTAGEDLVEALAAGGYDATVTDLYAPVDAVLDGDLDEVVDAILQTMEPGPTT